MILLNGRIPDAFLTTLGTDASGRPIRLQPDAAASLERFSEESGIAIGPSSISDSYRDYDRQVSYFKNPPNHVGLAAKPGTSSHGMALAIDARGALIARLTANGADHGWVRTIAAESWHFEYQESRDQHAQAEEGFLMALTDQQQADVYQRLVNIEGVAARLDSLVLAPGAKLDTLLQYATDTRNGVGGLPSLIAAVGGGAIDPEAIAKEVAAHLPGYTVSIVPR